MKKLINDPACVVEEMVEGLVLADSRLVRLPDETVVLRADHAALRGRGQVAIISGGGSGHEPAHAGYVGPGMLTAAVAGPVFTSPSVDAVLKAILAVGGPAGVLLIVKNYTGDKLNFGLAAEIARSHGVPVAVVLVGDDVALGDSNAAVGRRGIAGTILVHKIAGAAAEAGLSLDQVHAEAQAAADNLASMGLGLSACIVPAAGHPGFELGDDEVEFGLGIHGESGVRRAKIGAADAMLEDLVERILRYGGFVAGDEVALMVNGLGGTPALELAIATRFALQRLTGAGLVVRAVQAGTFLSALEMAGCSLSVMRLDALRAQRLLAATQAPAWNAPTIPATQVALADPVTLAEEDAVTGPAWANAAQAAGLAAAIRAVIALLREAEPELTRLDSAVGDGDLGISLARGADSLDAAFATLDCAHPARALAQVSALLRRSLGGTSGPLYAMAVLRAARALEQEADPADPAAWARALDAGCQGMMALGGAAPGDRTMLDALVPATAALAQSDGIWTQRVAAMHAAAQAGADATRAMIPRKGRSSYIGDRAAGHPDPGAVGVALWMGAINDWAQAEASRKG
ncbi:dihydroxyacetone kinase subunit DhaL [Novosphingobium sp. SG720]|uniref:dihydroxyacetone kinase subunit DhaL n=1 Tax=Novosphingobium sp. SG720 TaxID=2586998 RepID=UPI0014458E50|nr:dihydroxyacetone kinase subunit DhaL [Novosphingobium sp. SG720]NKJ44297.1 dihydroxyacetone kinase [Novosphingobium sp. SG720]